MSDSHSCTPKQAAILRKRGLRTDVPFDEASATIDKIAKKEGWGKPHGSGGSKPKGNPNGPATTAQIQVLERYHYDTTGLTVREASKLLDVLQKNDWKRPEYDEEPEVSEQDNSEPSSDGIPVFDT